ncbi:rhomboid family intramembrane serine protease [Actinotalea sp. M2MS4P-6]|nr:rhomboid family intramembrane serine protease [Actinotalea sp. M2MS4P-6]
MTYTLIAINVAAFALQLVLGRSFTGAFDLVPAYVPGNLYTLLTSAFLHASIPHIGFNMYALWILGAALEPALGRARLLTAYLVSAYGGGVVAVLMANPATSSWFTPMVGASGAVFGLFGVIFVVLRRMGRSARGIVVVLVINAVLGFVLPNVAWQAHLGGFVTGLLMGLAYAYVPRGMRRAAAIVAPVLLVLTLTLLLAVKLASV